MGAAASKQECDHSENQGADLEAKNVPSEAVSTPKTSRENLNQLNLDPRSPSKRFARTPVELLNAVADKLETLTLETGAVGAETPQRRHVVLPVDPRSPSLEVQRTPIVVSASKNEQFPEEIRNKTLDKVKISDLLNSPVSVSGTFARHVPPKLLSSCTVTPKLKVDAYKRKSLILLETNVDYTETDLDVVIREKCLGSAAEPMQKEATSVEERLDVSVESSSELEEDPVAIKDDPASESTSLDSLELEEEEPVATKESPASEPTSFNDLELEEDEPVATKEEPTSLENLDLEEDNQALVPSLADAQSTDSCSPVTELITKSAPVSPPHIVSVTPKKLKALSTSPVRSLSAEVLEFQKKLTNLIYEDEDPIVWPRAVKPQNQSRTPLGVRNGNAAVQKLKVSDKPRKTTSRIPVFKEKRVKIQCENTPPKSMRALKQPQKQVWDPKDETLFI